MYKPVVGEHLLVVEVGARGEKEPQEAEVVKVGRKLVTLRSLDHYNLQWVMDMESRIAKVNYGCGYTARYCTPEQWHQEQQVKEARAYLASQGIGTSWGSKFRYGDLLVKLAAAVAELLED